MTRRRLLVQVVTVSVVILIVILGDNAVKSDPLPDARSYIQNRPVYSKPSPKPRLALKLPSQLLLKENTTPQASKPAEDADDIERITQTVYGFLDFVTTIGNTVMVFTPQTKKVEAVNVEVKPTLASSVASVVKATPTPTLPPPAQEEEENVSTTGKPTAQQKRQPKQFLPEAPTIEASEVELEQEVTAVQAPPLEAFNTVVGRQEVKPIKAPAVVATPVPVVEPEIRTQVNVVASAPNLGSGEFIEGGDFPSSGEQEQQEQEEDDAPQVAAENPSTTTTTTTTTTTPPTTTTSTTPKPQSKSNKHGFTLKLTPKHNSPVIITPAFSVPVVVTAQKVDTPPPVVVSSTSVALQPTGLLNKIYETKVDKAGATTVLETAIIGTYIGTQYVRLLETTSSVLPIVAPQPTKAFQFPSLVKPTALAQQKVSTTTTTTSTPHTPDQDDEFEQDDQDTEEQPQPDQDDQDSVAHVQGEEEQTSKQSTSTTATPVLHLEPTPTASEEQTHYILPQKAEKIYVSPVPSPNAYSRGPGLYVDINPAKSAGDGGVAVVTATPTRGKQFRLTSNRFNPRNAKNQGGSDSNELTHQEVVAVPAQPDSSDSSRSRSRFGRNRGRSSSGGKNVEDVAVSTVVVSATPTRRFKSGRSSATVVTPAPPPPAQSSGRSKDFSSYKSGRGFTPSSRGGQQQQQNQQVNPTSSTSIYRFKLNRPTGRWRFKPSPKPKVNIIKTKEGDDQQENDEGGDQAASPGPIYHNSQSYSEQQGELQTPEETRTESNELVQELEPELVPQTIRVNTVTPTDFSDLEKFLEIATIRSPYVFQAGNVKNTRYITVTKTFTKEVIQPTLASSQAEASLENILATKPPYEKILEGSSDVATLPVIALGGDMATPPLETITQSFSTTQLMLKTSILPVLYDGVTTLYTLTQSYFITRLVTAHKTVPPVELFQFVPTKSLNEFNTALQEAGSEHREHLLGSESEDENDTNYEHIIAPPDELTSVGSDFDPSSMDEKLPKRPPKSSKEFSPRGGKSSSEIVSSSPNNNPFLNQSPPNFNSIPQDPLASIAGLTPEQLAFIRYFTAQNQQQSPQPQAFPQLQQQPQFNPFQQQQQQQAPLLPPSAPSPLIQAQQAVANGYSLTSSPVVVDTLATVTETKTLRLLFGAKPTHTVLYSTRVVPTRMTSYVTASLPVKPTQAIIQNNPFLNGLPFPLAYVG
ncbi:mucin-5AC isoform X2 [Folsomia candida]|uniref:mucin-5AC isoform X2 n=1 Tax=Folsomia candida TaxID=158441 RepID=UPI000B9053F5|nr:mucin-5AC isoform X2 [Folsomia candida]